MHTPNAHTGQQHRCKAGHSHRVFMGHQSSIRREALFSAHAVTLTHRVRRAVAVHLPKYSQTMGFNLILKIWS